MNILKINGTAISGIYVDAAVSFNKPAKRVQSISVPGRNGNLIIDEGAFDNVLISYPVYEKNSFPMEFDSIVNWLSSLEGYQRIECSNDPTHFRLGRFVVPQTPTAKRLNRDGYYQLSFDCKPQRYLNLGEVPTEIDANPSETYGPADIVSFEAAQEDTISGAEFSIVPQQDLHGYDSPWPAGGGKNLLNADGVSVTAIVGESHQTDIATVQMVQGQTYMISCYQSVNIPTSTRNTMSVALNGSYYYNTTLTNANPNAGRQSWTFTAPSTGEATIRYWANMPSATATIDRFMVNAGSTLEDYAPYSNICPISGFTGAEITDRGVNLWNEEWELGSYNSSGQKTSDANRIRNENFIPCKPNTTYYVVRTATATFHFYNVSKTFISSYTLSGDNLFTTPSNCYYVNFNTGSSATPITTYNHDISINYPSTDTAYHASVGATKSITWQDEAGTVYGGTLQYLSGDSWRLTKTMESVDLGSRNWTNLGTYFRATIGSSNVKRPASETTAFNGFCSCYKVSYMNDTANSIVTMHPSLSNNILYTRDVAKQSMSAEDYKAALAGQKLVYELATPVVYDLTSEELARIVGQNNIFANCGQSTVVITEPTYFVNPGYFASKPIIRVYGDGTFRVGDNIITIAAHTQPYIDIDSELQDCYCGDTNMNEYVTFTSGEYPVLVPGSNYVLMGEGITKLIITPNWWEL